MFKNLVPASFYGKLTLIIVLLQAIIVIVLESYVASVFLPNQSQFENTPAVGIPVYLMIFLFSQVFQVVLCFDAVLHQNTIQIIAFVIFDALVFAYSLFQYFQLKDALAFASVSTVVGEDKFSGVLIAISVVLGVCLIAFVYLAFKLYLEFGWKIYKKIGADPRMKKMYRLYQIFLAILKLDFFFFLAFSIQFLVLVLNPNDPEYALTIIAVPVIFFMLMFAVYGLRQENRIVMGIFIAGCMCACAYFVFKLVRMYTPSQEFKYLYSRKFLTFFALLNLLFVLITLVISVLCLLNFDKGLKQHINNQSRGRQSQSAAQGGQEMTQTGGSDGKQISEMLFHSMALIIVWIFAGIISQACAQVNYTCQSVSNLTFCQHINYSSYLPATANLTALDQTANQSFSALKFSLYQFKCSDSESSLFYSLLKTCEDCTAAYKTWICAITFPRCSASSNNSSNLLKPCQNVCFNVARSCPSFLNFVCPTYWTIDTDYGTPPDCNDAGLNN
ncbi:hypothetical protein MIR68_011543 [Amoeboaphelidium protococcarum]|nr:hypothetical protein MIR68_011543 [Amoeboaphelidium protococcarum]